MHTILVFRTGVQAAWSEKFAGISAFAREAGWQLQTIDARLSKPTFKDLIDFWSPRGILADASGDAAQFRNAPFAGIPTVYLNPETDAQGARRLSVISDPEGIVRLAAHELLSREVKALVYVDWFSPVSWSESKRAVLRTVARLHKLPFHIITPCRNAAQDSVRLMRQLSAELKNLPQPSGVFAVNDVVGAAVITAAGKAGIRIPEDLSVVSVDDDPEICENCSPTLTSIRPDFFRMGFAAGRLLRQAIESTDEQPSPLTIPPLSTVRRASSRTLADYDAIVNKALELIRLKACEGLTPADAAALFGASRRSAELRFKAATGQTIGDAILAIRLKAACEYLANGTSSVAAIANFCGWKSDLAFRKVFKSRFGISPRQWKSNTEQTDKQPRRDATPAAPPPEGTPRVRGVPSRDQPNL